MASVIQLLMTIWAYGFFFVPACLALSLVCGWMFDLENRAHSILVQAAVIVGASLFAYYAVNMTSANHEEVAERHYGPFDY